MGYCGGLGAGKGWHAYHFLIDPDELDEMLHLQRISLVEMSGRVDADYNETPVSEYVERYGRYLQGPWTDPSPDWTVRAGLDISLTTRQENITAVTCPGARFKLLRAAEPVIGFQPLPILFADSKLFVNIMGKGEGYFGMSMTFAKVISFDSERHESFCTPLIASPTSPSTSDCAPS